MTEVSAPRCSFSMQVLYLRLRHGVCIDEMQVLVLICNDQAMPIRSEDKRPLFSRRFHSILYVLLCQLVIFPFGVAAAQEEPSDDLLRRLRELKMRIGDLQVRAATEKVKMATNMYYLGQLYYPERYGTTPKIEFGGYLRFGADYNRFASQSVVSRVGGDAEDSLRRLDELLAEAEQIVEQSGSSAAQALLNEARFFRNQAEAELAAGDEEAALEDMSISESLALEAARVAGEEITTETEDEQWDVFSEVKLGWVYRQSPSTRHEWTNYLREGDEYFQERLEWKFEHQVSGTSKLFFKNAARIRDYQDAILDDYFSDSMDLRWRWQPDEHWTLRVENRFDYRSEYKADPDEGYWSESPRGVLEYSWGSFHEIQIDYGFRRQEFLSGEEKEFNSKRHTLRQRYDYYGASWRLNLMAEEQWRDFNKPLEEDDYREIDLQLDFAYDLLGGLSLGAQGGLERRRYALRGGTNTDFIEWRAGPLAELRWTGDLLQTLRYEWTGRTHRDRDGTDELDKHIGDFDEHRVALETWWNVTDQFNVSLNLEGEWRWYRNGQTGDYETFLSDFRPLSNYTRYTISSNFDYDWSDRLRLSGSFYHSEETHKRFSSFDLRETTMNFEVQVLF